MRDGKRGKRGEQTEVAILHCVCEGCRRGTSLSHHLLSSYFFTYFVYNKTITADGAATLPKHTHTRVLEAAASQYFALLSPFSYKKGILILGDQRSSKTIYSSLTNVRNSQNFPCNLK